MAKRKGGQLNAARLRELARAGADQAVKQLQAELALAKRRRALRRSITQAARRTTRMSVAARKAVSDRMKRYWAERRKAQAKIK